MLYFLAELLQSSFGPLRLFQSHAVLIALALYCGFLITVFFLPKTFPHLPMDRGREFTLNPDAAAGKPTGAGVVFISIFVLLVFLFIFPSPAQIFTLGLTWLVMISGYLDDRSKVSWSEYRKAIIDFVLSLITAGGLFFLYFNQKVFYWLPFTTTLVEIHPITYFIVSVTLLWVSINTTNCSDGIDGLSAVLVLIALFSLGVVFYFIIGHVDVAHYLLVPHLKEGARWAVLIFGLAGVLMGYLWHNAFPGKVMMGDAGSRALGFFIGILIIIAGNPFLFLITSTILFVNGGTGLFKVALLRFFKIRIFKTVRFPLHDHMRKNLAWSPTQVLIKFVILQLLITIALLGVLFKIR